MNLLYKQQTHKQRKIKRKKERKIDGSRDTQGGFDQQKEERRRMERQRIKERKKESLSLSSSLAVGVWFWPQNQSYHSARCMYEYTHMNMYVCMYTLHAKLRKEWYVAVAVDTAI